ncbi:MAG: hypothetical protein AAF206_20190 [Bacteroidota bacterium]
MNTAPTFHRSLLGSTQSKVDANQWEKVTQLYEAGRYHEAIVGILRYVDPQLPSRTGDEELRHFVIPHGSIVVELSIEAESVSVRAPFLGIRDANQIALLRQVAQINFTPLNLANIMLEGEKLVFSYSSPLDACEPYKMYELFREICYYADYYDDEFIKKFNASRLREPVIHPFPDAQKQRIWDQIQAYLQEAFRYIEHFETKRQFGYAWQIISISLMRIEYFCSPQGLVRSEIEQAMEVQDANGQLTDKIARGKEFLRKLEQYEAAEFQADLYKTQTFIPYKFRSTIENIRSNFQDAYQSAKQDRDSNDHLSAALSMMQIFLKLFFYNNVNDEIAAPITNALEAASNQAWGKASDELWQAMHHIMTEELQRLPQPKAKGFWGRLFG